MADQDLTTSPEIFKPIPDWPAYDVSNRGQVRSFYKGQGRGPWKIVDVPQKILKPKISRGYPVVTLVKSGIRYFVGIHRLVLLTFIGPCPPGYECCHNDGIRSHCVLENLRWDTRSSNAQERFKHGNSNYQGDNNNAAKLTEQKVIQIRALVTQEHLSKSAIARMFGVQPTTIWAIANRITWSHIP